MDTGLWADVACVALDRGVRFLLMGDFRQLFAGARVERPLKDSDLLQDLAGGYCHELTENRRSDERIFQFISWLRVGEAEEVPLAEAVRVARREFPRRVPSALPRPPGSDQRAGEPAPGARGRRAD